jgi:two-component system sensor histidine kinase DegS
MLGHYDDHVATRLSNQPILLMEEERHRFARELHDDLLQKLTALSLRLDPCRQLSLTNNSAALQEELAQLKRCWQESLASMRQPVEDSRPHFGQGDPVFTAVVRLAGEFEEQSGIRVSIDLGCLPESRLHSAQREALVHILAEALRNTRQHACAKGASIRAQHSGEALRVIVEDDGVGFDLRSVLADYPRRGLGLAGMMESARHAGGGLQIESKSGRGTVLTLVIPLQGLQERRGYALGKPEGYPLRG